VSFTITHSRATADKKKNKGKLSKLYAGRRERANRTEVTLTAIRNENESGSVLRICREAVDRFSSFSESNKRRVNL